MDRVPYSGGYGFGLNTWLMSPYKNEEGIVIKRCVLCIVCIACLSPRLGLSQVVVAPDDVIRAVERMTPDQAYEFSQKLEARMWEPVPESIFTRFGVFAAAASTSFKKVDISGVDLASRNLNIDDVMGLEYGIMWRVARKTRVGLKADIWMSQDSSLTEAGYSRVEFDASAMSVALNYRLFEERKWTLWTELDLGGGTVELRTANTPVATSTTDRYFDGDFAMANIQVGLAWRLNSLVSLYGSGSYRFASSGNFEEGGKKSNMEFDASGFGMQLGLGVNY